MSNAPPIRTGFASLDEAPRPPKTLSGITVLSDPTGVPQSLNRVSLWETGTALGVQYGDLDRAYRVDSYVRQGVDKYVELGLKEFWSYDCPTDEPIEYLTFRFDLMGIMTWKDFAILVAELFADYVKYHNAYWIKKRGRPTVSGLPETGALGEANPILGYFRADPKRLTPEFSADGKRLIRWKYTLPNGKFNYFKANDVIHFSHSVTVGEVLGSPYLASVLEDVRAYRQAEEYLIRLLYKHLNPLLHHEVPDTTGGYGTDQGTVDQNAFSHAVMAPDGMIVTPPGHKINMIGAESRALRAEGYMQLLKQRVFTGLGVSQVAMGEGENSTAGSADAQTVTMHNKAKFLQFTLGRQLTLKVLYELLIEGGFNPLSAPDKTSWRWGDFEIEKLLKLQNNEVQKFGNNLTTRTRALRAMGERPLSPEEEKDTHVYLVSIPEMEAAAEAKAAAAPAPSGQAKAVAAKARPSNQHGKRSGPKVRPR